MTQTNPFNHLRLDEEEAQLEAALARGEFISVPDLAATKKLFAQAAKHYRALQKSKPITIRVNQEDLLYAEDQTQLQL